jgi:hypothetical protein
MANQQLYSNAYVTIDGKLLTEEASVSIDKKSGLNPVFTVAKGLAGMSQGAGVAEISIENAVPSTDFEFNPDPYMKSGAVVEIGVVMANRQSVFKGFITDATYSHAVNSESKLSLKITAGFEVFE